MPIERSRRGDAPEARDSEKGNQRTEPTARRDEMRRLWAEVSALDLAYRRERTHDASNVPMRLRLEAIERGDYIPAAYRPEWQRSPEEQVEAFDWGIIDERARRFSRAERRCAELLAGEGSAVVAMAESTLYKVRSPDAEVDGAHVEFKSLRPGAVDRTVAGRLNAGKGQADAVLIDARGSGLDERQATHGIALFSSYRYAHRLKTCRIVGDEFDTGWILLPGDDDGR